MERDELYKPLGREPDPLARKARGAVGRRVLLVAIPLAICVSAVAYWTRQPSEQPLVSAKIAHVSAPRAPMVSSTGTTAPAAVGESDIEDGVRVIRGGAPGSARGGSIIRIPSDAASPALSAAPDPRLVQASRFGPLPKVADDGSKPFDVYRRPFAASGGLPRIGLIVTGLGLNRTLTAVAASELPPQTTFAFASLGADLPSLAAQARAAGHEVLLQVPMEPLATEGAPWPHELTTSAGNAKNIDDLRWSLSRFPGYFGVINFLGSKFTADRTALSPVLKEIATRGLAYIDDGASAQSFALAIAGNFQMQAAHADVSIDGQGGADSVDASLAKLESLARARGFALGVVAGLPLTVERVRMFASRLGVDGVELAPASALASPTPSVATSTK